MTYPPLISPASRTFWNGRSTLVTGHTGFKGSWLSLLLHRLGARVVGLGLAPDTQPNLHGHIWPHLANTSSYIGNINDEHKLSKIIKDKQPEIIFHLAAQPLVRQSYREPIQTLETNILGTARLLNACRYSTTVRTIVVVTTDKVYENKNWPYPYREEDTLGGHDPYSASKAATELVTRSMYLSYLQAQGVAVATARAGNVIGGGDWSADRLIPDAVREWSEGRPVVIRNPDAIRPWQHVLEPLAGYLILAESMTQRTPQFATYNFAPNRAQGNRVADVIKDAAAAWGPGARVTQTHSAEAPHEAHRIDLDNSRAYHDLGVWPLWTPQESVRRTVAWYKDFYGGKSALTLCEGDVEAFIAEALKARATV